MKLDIRRMLLEEGAPQEGDATFDFSRRDFYGYAVVEPAKLHYKAEQKYGIVLLRVRVEAILAAECARCLVPVQEALCTENNYEIRSEDFALPVPEVPLSPDGMLDLEELAYGEIVLEAPQAILCGEECVGLCSRCGKPVAECRCPPEDATDPRWAALQDLLKN